MLSGGDDSRKSTRRTRNIATTSAGRGMWCRSKILREKEVELRRCSGNSAKGKDGRKQGERHNITVAWYIYRDNLLRVRPLIMYVTLKNHQSKSE